MRQGLASPGELPRADRTVLVLPASDVLLLQGAWPHLEKLPASRWREALPHLLEESLVTPAEWCHFAPSPAKGADGQWTVAVVDLAWMRHLHRLFCTPDRSVLHMVSSVHLQPENTLVRTDVPGTHDVVLSWRGSGWAGWGLRTRQEDLPLQARWPGMPGSGLTEQVGGMAFWARPGAPEKAIDLCQYGFVSRTGWLGGRWHPWRRVIGLTGLALGVYLAGFNLYWFKLSLQKRHLEQAMHELVQARLTQVPATLPPLVALRRAMDTRDQQDLFLARLDALARLLEKAPGDAVQSLDYQEGALKVHFKPGFRVEGLKPSAGRLDIRWKEAEPGVWMLEAEGP